MVLFNMPYSESFLLEAIRLSKEHMKAGEGGPFGAVVVKDGKIIGRGWNCVTSSNDPTAHAEVMAIRDACQALATFKLEGCELYASCEPCPMCLSAIYWARLDSLYFAASHHDAGDAGFDDTQLYEEMKLNWQDRKLSAEQHLQTEAQHVFALWKNKLDRIDY
jgi:tRNA(Arg) A34 adenosine deaminase TadA